MKSLANLSKFEIKETSALKGGLAGPPAGSFTIPGSPFYYSFSESVCLPGNYFFNVYSPDGEYLGGMIIQPGA